MRRVTRLLAAVTLLTIAPPAHAQNTLRALAHASGFSSPVAIVQDPTDPLVQFVVEQGGRIRVVSNGAVRPTDFLDLRPVVQVSGERGLLGMALAPDYPASGRFYVNFTNTAGDTVIARHTRSSNSLVADPASRFDLRLGGSPTVAQPFSNHNGGHLAFGPDGFLYVGLGDGGSGNDPAHRAQDPSTLLGKMLRIDVDVPAANPTGYRIPSDNPFVTGGPSGSRPEIWSFGLRNPWRYNFDDPARGGTGALVIADVGQNAWEEIDYEPAGRSGRNYGWRNREGAHTNVNDSPPAFLPLIDPIFEYSHVDGQSITGGYVYRGRALGTSFSGRYFFADFFGRVWSLALTLDASGEAQSSDLREHTAELGGAALGMISAFGLDADGELFVVSYSTGTVFRILGGPAPPARPTGLRIIR